MTEARDVDHPLRPTVDQQRVNNVCTTSRNRPFPPKPGGNRPPGRFGGPRADRATRSPAGVARDGTSSGEDVRRPGRGAQQAGTLDWAVVPGMVVVVLGVVVEVVTVGGGVTWARGVVSTPAKSVPVTSSRSTPSRVG